MRGLCFHSNNCFEKSRGRSRQSIISGLRIIWCGGFAFQTIEDADAIAERAKKYRFATLLLWGFTNGRMNNSQAKPAHSAHKGWFIYMYRESLFHVLETGERRIEHRTPFTHQWVVCASILIVAGYIFDNFARTKRLRASNLCEWDTHLFLAIFFFYAQQILQQWPLYCRQILSEHIPCELCIYGAWFYKTIIKNQVEQKVVMVMVSIRVIVAAWVSLMEFTCETAAFVFMCCNIWFLHLCCFAAIKQHQHPRRMIPFHVQHHPYSIVLYRSERMCEPNNHSHAAP